MFDINSIANCLFGRIGFNPEKDTELAKVDTDLRISRSGLYWEEGHALVTLEKLQAIAEDQDQSTYPAYNNIVLYGMGALVTESSKIYRKLTGAPAGTPVTDTTAWSETSTLGIWLRSKVNAAIKKVVSDMYTRKKVGRTIKSVLEDSYLYDGAGNRQDMEIKGGRFVGFQIIFRGRDGLMALIDKVSTQFTEAMNEDLTLYLYHTGENDAIATVQITPNKAYSVQWHTLQKDALNVAYSGPNSSIGGAWFLGYYEDDLPLGVQAINRSNYNFQTGPCGSCGNNSYWIWSQWFRWVSIIPFAVMPGNLQSDRSIWDWNFNQYYYESKTWGVNLHFSVKCNVSDLICRQQELFDQVLLKQFAVTCLHEIAYNTRINVIAEKTQQKAMFELDDRDTSSGSGSSGKRQKGLKSELADAIEAIDFDFSDFGSVCAPCDERRGVTVRGI